jgi:hypothetical protein
VLDWRIFLKLEYYRNQNTCLLFRIPCVRIGCIIRLLRHCIVFECKYTSCSANAAASRLIGDDRTTSICASYSGSIQELIFILPSVVRVSSRQSTLIQRPPSAHEDVCKHSIRPSTIRINIMRRRDSTASPPTMYIVAYESPFC